MAINLEKMDRAELEQLKSDIDRQLAQKASDEKKLALAEAEKAAAQFGYSLAELTGADNGRKLVKAKASGVVKFRNPEDATKTWSGRGRRPEWIKVLDAEGRLEDARV
jgi:DNA-binding protein H-NS